MIQIHIFHTGSVQVDDAIPHGSKNPFAVTGLLRGKDKQRILPVSCYLIEHPKGRLLIDTGWDSNYVTEKPHRFLGLLDSISTPIISQGESVDCKLAQLGLTPKDLDYVFFSHLDFDHTSGLRLVRDAKQFLAAQEELKDAKTYFFRYVKSNWAFVTVEPFVYQHTGIGPVGKSYDVFGDGTVQLVNTPGHSHGLFTAVIQQNGQFVALAGDSIYTQKSIKERRIPGFTVNKALAQKSLDWICQLAVDPNCLGVFANHDPQIPEQTITI